MLRGVFAGLAMLMCAAQLSAQITTYVAPPRPAQPSAEAIATADSIRRDSVTQLSMRNMKEWVDSAAGVPVPAYDTAVTVVRDSAGHTAVTTFSNGTVAPETASDLPTLAILGIVGLVVGAGLLANKPRG